jgi:hypothetical protein
MNDSARLQPAAMAYESRHKIVCFNNDEIDYQFDLIIGIKLV